MRREHRTQHVEVRASTDSPGLFEAEVMRYGILDDYRTIFDPEVFRASLEERLPRITWGHDWADVIGQYVDYRDTRDALTLVGQLDDFDAVPRARQAHAQLLSGTIDQFSVGFRRGETYEDDQGVTHFRTATLDEVALVLSGAVPGTKLLAVRSAGQTRQVPEALVIDLAKQVAAGTLSKDAAYIALDLAVGDPLSGAVPAGAPGGDASPAMPVPAAGIPDPAPAADEALAALGLTIA